MNRQSRRNRSKLPAAALLVLSLTTTCVAQHDGQIDSIMYHDPQFELPLQVVSIPAALKPLWLKALNRPEADLRRLAANTIALAHQRGMQGLSDTRDALAEIVAGPDQDALVRRAAAYALISLDAKQKAGVLADFANAGGFDEARLVEPALARWNHQASRSKWLARLEDPTAPRAGLLLAIDALATVKASQASEPLRRIVAETHRPRNVRLAAARALARLHDSGLVDDAKDLSSKSSPEGIAGRLLALAMLERHADENAIALLRELGSDDEPAVAASALNRLFDIDPSLMFDLAPAAIARPDVNVRRMGARALVIQGDVPAVRLLAPLLDDVNPTLRRYVTDSLIELAAQNELRESVIEQATDMLASDRWRGLEQASVVLVQLDHKPAAGRLIELLEHPRGEVLIAAAWALRRLRIPDTLPAMLDRAERAYRSFRDRSVGDNYAAVAEQVSQLFQAFGELRYAEADSLMRNYVPKDFTLGVRARAAACFALGYLYEGQAPEDLTAQFLERLADTLSMPPEAEDVRWMCALSLGRMKSESAVPGLREYTGDELGGYVPQACAWAIEQITGEPPPPVATFRAQNLDWFLVPIE